MALGCCLVIAGPIPPPKKAEAQKAPHIKQSLAVTPPVTPQPQAVAQPETPPAQPAAVETPPPPAPAPVVGCGSDPYMAYIYQHESGCRTDAVNPASGAYGLCQA